MTWRGGQILGSMGMLAALGACGTETVVHKVEEREANQMVELLAENDINASKGMADDGRTVSFSIAVPAGRKLEAIKLLNRYEMPRRHDLGYMEVFKDSGLIPTASEERAKQAAALEGEIERQLKLVDGILDVQVQLVQPDESPLRTSGELRTPATASVTIKYMPAAGGAKPLSEPQVQELVAKGVERLTADNVVVVMTPGGPMVHSDRADAEPRGPARGIADKTVRGVGLVVGAVLLVLVGVVFVLWFSLRTARGRLTRLQSEIARARRRPDGAPPAA